MNLVVVITPTEMYYKRVSEKYWQIILLAIPKLGHNSKDATVCFIERHLQKCIFNTVFHRINSRI